MGNSELRARRRREIEEDQVPNTGRDNILYKKYHKHRHFTSQE